MRLIRLAPAHSGDASDFLAVLPAGAEIKDTSPVKLFVTRGACEGSAALRLLGQRTPLKIRAYRGGLAAPRLLATSAAVVAPSMTGNAPAFACATVAAAATVTS